MAGYANVLGRVIVETPSQPANDAFALLLVVAAVEIGREGQDERARHKNKQEEEEEGARTHNKADMDRERERGGEGGEERSCC